MTEDDEIIVYRSRKRQPENRRSSRLREEKAVCGLARYASRQATTFSTLRNSSRRPAAKPSTIRLLFNSTILHISLRPDSKLIIIICSPIACLSVGDCGL
jgi:hypothetical protein